MLAKDQKVHYRFNTAVTEHSLQELFALYYLCDNVLYTPPERFDSIISILSR